MNTTKEKIKTLFLCVLIIGMLYLTYSVWFFDSPFGSLPLGELMNIIPQDAIEEETEESDLERFGIRPFGILIRESESPVGVVNNSRVCDEIYLKLRKSIKDVLSSGENISLSDEKAWEKAVAGNGFILDYGENIPIDALCAWLGIKELGDNALARNYMFSTEGKKVKLYMKNSKNGQVYVAESSVGCDSVKEITREIFADKVLFASETGEDQFLVIRKENIIPEARKKIPVISAYNSYSLFNTDAKNACLESFRLIDVTPSVYSEQDGTEVYIADMITLKISPEGIVSYTDPREYADETLGIGVESAGEVPTLAEKTEAARMLVSSIASRLPGSGGIYIMSISESGEGTEVIFGRHIGGIPVDMKDTAYFARVVIRGASVHTANINLRGYDETTQVSEILSDRLAAAAVSGSGKSGDMNIRYPDSGNELIYPSWYVSGREDNNAEEEK